MCVGGVCICGVVGVVGTIDVDGASVVVGCVIASDIVGVVCCIVVVGDV